jgi:hypothetical protein
MPPKPQVFKSPDGKEFTSKAEWRDYMMLTFYTFKNKHNEPQPLIKEPGSIGGQMFDIADCSNSTLVVLDQSEQVQIDQLENCRVFIAACASSIFIRNCTNCVFYTCCRQLRLREVTNTKFYIFSMSEVHIEFSNNVSFAPFNGGYPDHKTHLQQANLDLKQNLWYDVYDHNDPGKSGNNWSLIPESEYETPWLPLGACEPAIPRTRPGAVQSKTEDSGGMQSFSLQQMMQDANKIASPPKALKTSESTVTAAPAPPAVPTNSTTSSVGAAETTVAPSSANIAPTQIPQTILDDNEILEKVRAFISLQARTASSVIHEIVDTNKFQLVLPNALVAKAEDVAVSAADFERQLLVQETIEYSTSRDMAYLTVIAQDTRENNEDLVAHFTFIFRNIDGKWLIVHAQKSTAVVA